MNRPVRGALARAREDSWELDARPEPAVTSNGRDTGELSDRRLRSAKVSLVHDYLNQRGGAERVVLELSYMWPHAPIYTSLYRPESTFPEFGQARDPDHRPRRAARRQGVSHFVPVVPRRLPHAGRDRCRRCDRQLQRVGAPGTGQPGCTPRDLLPQPRALALWRGVPAGR
jgi:hypothetical protein